MPNKPIKWSYMIWTRAHITGYIDEFQIYTEKVEDIIRASSDKGFDKVFGWKA